MDVVIVKKRRGRLYDSRTLLGRALAYCGAGEVDLLRDERGVWRVNSSEKKDVLHVSVSHTQGYWACLISDTGPVGLDIEERNRKVRAGTARALHPDEQRCLEGLAPQSREYSETFLDIWTRKESYVKYLGSGLSAGMSTFSVVDESGRFSSEIRQGDGPVAYVYALDAGLALTAAACMPVEGAYASVRTLRDEGQPAKSPLEHAGDALSRRDHTAYELRRKLLRHGHGEQAAEEAIATLKDEGYISDAQFAERYARRAVERGRGQRRVVQELQAKGIDSDVAAEAAREASAASEHSDFDRAMEQAAFVLQRAGTSFGEALPDRLLQRVARRLSSLGYESHVIWRVLDRLRSKG